MKRQITFIIALTAIAAAFFFCHKASAQTNVDQVQNLMSNLPVNPTLSGGLQQIYDSATSATNYGLAFGGARSATGQRSVAFAELAYNFTPSVGLVIGYDYLWASKHLNQSSQANLVKGGINLQADIQPLKNFGLTNFTVTPFGFALVATGNGTVSEILGAGIKTKIYSFKGFNLDGGIIYESRTGAGFWDGKYAGGFLALTKGF